MASEPIPDHYKALGVDKKADAATIKATYRKLVLKCHPDKVTDPALKEQKQEEFHQIQQAYEVLIDDEKRSHYEASITLEKLRKENAAARAAASARDKTARFDVRTSGGAKFTTTGPSRYETVNRVPSKQRDDDRARGKYETYETQPKSTSASRSSREKESSSRSTRASTSDRTRSDREKARTKEVRSDHKFVHVESESSSDEKARYEAAYKRRSAEEERRKEEGRRSYEDTRYTAPAHQKMSAQAEEALRYQHKSRAQVEDEMARPSPARASSREYYHTESRSARRDTRPEPVRRSSARPGKERPSLSRRDTDRIPEVVEWDDRREERRIPAFKHVSSSPAELARGVPQRSYTENSSHHRHGENTPPQPPAFTRSATMPSVPNTSARRKESAAPRPSGLRETMAPEHHSSPERDTYATVPPQPTTSGNTTKYYYPVPGAGVSARPENVPAPRHVYREPTRHHRSPSPIGKPPIGPNRPAEPITSYKTVPRPTMGSRTESSRNISPIRSSEDRGRSRKLYGEVGSDSRREVRQPSYSPEEVQYSRKYGPEDVRWAPRTGDDRYASKPMLGRTAPYVY